jgi:hypothetical protein
MRYITAWIGEMISINRYLPGVYCSYLNANQIKNNSLASAFWVWKLDRSCPEQFTTTFPSDSPSNTGIEFATVWQMIQNCMINAGETVINVDLNTATTNNPSI